MLTSTLMMRICHSGRSGRARCLCTTVSTEKQKAIELQGTSYPSDTLTNVSPAILQKVGTDLHRQPNHPICLMKLRIQNFFYKKFVKRGNPTFSVYDNLSPVVTLQQNFENLLVPQDHPSRNPSDSYYLNSNYMLRAHTTAHQRDLIKSGLDKFLIAGDVYRRDTVDSSHYPVFHQLDGVCLFSKHELFGSLEKYDKLELFDDMKESELNQAGHSLEGSLMVQHDLKNTLEMLATDIFGKDIETRWVEEYFPFTHPSWELEIKYQDKWMEVLGCGVIQQQILNESGAQDKIGWAFGLGLERLAMKLYNIPDIRLFWSQDPRFLSQFNVDDPSTPVTFQPFSSHPPVYNDISFWIPDSFEENNFFDVIRSVAGNIVEEVSLIDSYHYSKKQRTSKTYRISYRHMERAMSKDEANELHNAIAEEAKKMLGVQIR